MMKPISDCRTYFDLLAKTMGSVPFDEIDRVSELLVKAYEEERSVYIFGNGGSAALASHFACDLGKGTVNGSPKRFRVLALTDNVPLMTAWANDSKYEDIFSEQLANFARARDIAFAISGSGNSPNVLRALRAAKHAGLLTAGLTGFCGGRMRELCDACIVVPCDNMQIIEDLHVCVAHALFTCVRSKINQLTPVYAWMRPGLVTRRAGK
jgi:D-sedoheptulose 7-phosphate isomerase